MWTLGHFGVLWKPGPSNSAFESDSPSPSITFSEERRGMLFTVCGKGGYWTPRRGWQIAHSSEEGFLMWWGDFQMGQMSGL